MILLLETNNRSNTIILFAKLSKQKRLKDYLKTEILFFELLNIINIIEELAKILRKLEV